jgi:hypothetical protein
MVTREADPPGKAGVYGLKSIFSEEPNDEAGARHLGKPGDALFVKDMAESR